MKSVVLAANSPFMNTDLLQKYNVAVPRYTSYPSVPLWDKKPANPGIWMEDCVRSFEMSGELSVYIHLPYCESLCTYCGCNKHITKNHLVEEPYVRAVIKEWELYTSKFKKAPVIRELHLGGGTPTFFSPESLRLLINGILKTGVPAENHNFSFEAHPSSTSLEHLKVLRELGFNRLSLGVQDFDDRIMKVINRFQTIEQISDITVKARELGYTSINYDLIYGLPLQTPENIKHNLELIGELKPDRIAFYSYAHIPEVKKAQRAYSEKDLPMGMDKLKLYQLGKLGLEKLGYVEIGMDHFALKSDELYQSMKSKSLHRNFMGYTPYSTPLSIGLGASAISDSGTAYAQNEKSVKDYLLKMKEADLPPITKTHFLTDEDKYIRKQILDLICNFQTDWLDNPAKFEFKLQQAFVEMERDGLLKIFPYQVKVSQTGRSFIRNICRVFDKRMDRHQEALTFSKAV